MFASQPPSREFVIDTPEVSVVMPCLNEEAGLAACIEKIRLVYKESGIIGEIIVADNGSTDCSVEIAERLGVSVVHQPLLGYGSAYLKGFSAARGDYLVMADADDTYDFSLIPVFISKLKDQGFDFVTGSRYAKGGDRNIPFLHRYVGNPLLTLVLNLLFQACYSDVYCGYRAFTRKAYDLIQPVSPGMEFNLELAINAHLAGLKVDEIPISLAVRKGVSKLNTFRDGWRSLRMMLLYCPNSTFLLPGLTLFITGALLHLFVLLRVLRWDGRPSSTITGLFATILTVVGFQVLSLGLHAKTYSWSRRFDRDNQTLEGFYRLFKLETGLAVGTILILSGMGILTYFLLYWLHTELQPLPFPEWIPPAASLIIVGFNVVFTSLFVSAMSLSKQDQ
jgi:glycosyltransferase involved in cell wall biosynthesis